MSCRPTLSALFPLLLAAVAAQGQITLTWVPRADLNASLPASLRVYEASNSTVPIHAWYVSADLRDTTWQAQALLSDESDGRETVPQFAAGAKSWIAINGGYFGSSGGTTASFSLVADRGVVLSPNIGALNRNGVTYFPTRSAFGLLRDGTPDVAWIYDVAGVTYAYPEPSPNKQGQPQPQPSATFPANGAPWPLWNAIGGGPVLIHNGSVRITWEEEVFFGSGIGNVDDRHPRTAVGYTADGRLLLMVVDGRQVASRGASLTELAQFMLALGAVEAVNLDGGGSSTLVVGQTLINRPSDGVPREVASAFVLAPGKSEPPIPGETLYFDTGDSCCYRERGAWFESANTPFYGTTKARLNQVGVGQDRAVFRFGNLTAGRYEVAAWWVPAGNRAGNTPFFIFHAGDSVLVRVDQSNLATQGKWNVLGEFELAAGDCVVVTDQAAGTASPAYVCVDAIRLVHLGAGSAVRSAQTAPPRHYALQAHPNPARQQVKLSFSLPRAGPVEIRMLDLLGRVVARTSGRAQAGFNQMQLAWRHIPAGRYVIVATTAAGEWHTSLTVVH
ncbi:MAG: phosphodiester glycosidase family protein [candidate division KSB1 bacterium]|nr:phosphodiester glycosidase family protein [candidate division KSB1 bacterium]MDZ7272991.1 phosphodiester glycosidase family protein [candidate division KSB1 bacterium]MDZ7285094.1 phosphodiester glycosidase family protein [candidate division KSB1 bacterium]MDZ7298126.1 phosphodiester glycosidase family protein [candidate division KSB1 bacterium]MDZ7309257.1 phosphodiester glycosidase family protein [candidate division KSB1 bacterium]